MQIRILEQSDIAKCPFVIFWPEHYRADGSCKCNDPEHRRMMMAEWKYTEQIFIDAGTPLREKQR